MVDGHPHGYDRRGDADPEGEYHERECGLPGVPSEGGGLFRRIFDALTDVSGLEENQAVARARWDARRAKKE